MIYQKYIKRVLDLAISIVLIIILSWLLIILAMIIYFTDGRPVIFSQERIGQYGIPFRIYKFRTMVKNAESIGPKSTPKNDPRITPIGMFLRKTSLDELPQLINTLKGNMSLVGYRPGVRENYDDEDFKSGMFDVKPGITGYAQVNGRSEIDPKAKKYWELKYVEDISLITDLRILIKTIAVVFGRNGSY